MPIRNWSEDEFLDRVRRRVSELGQSESALLRVAGLSADLIRKSAGRGRRIDSIISICRALDWTLEEALGLSPPAQIDPEMLRLALAVVERQVPLRVLERREIVAHGVALFYDILAHRKERGQPALEEEEAAQLAEALITGMMRRPAAGRSAGRYDGEASGDFKKPRNKRGPD
jgi:hypothetical protein